MRLEVAQLLVALLVEVPLERRERFLGGVVGEGDGHACRPPCSAMKVGRGALADPRREQHVETGDETAIRRRARAGREDFRQTRVGTQGGIHHVRAE